MGMDLSADQPASRTGPPATERNPHDYLAMLTGELQTIRVKWGKDSAYSEALRELDEAMQHLRRSWQALPRGDEAAARG